MKILVIDDELSLLKLLERSLKDATTEVITADTAAKGLDAFKEHVFDIVLCDIGLPDKNGLDVLGDLKAVHPEIPVIMITANGSVESALKSMKLGAYDYIAKPFDPEEMKILIERSLKEKSLEKRVVQLQQEVFQKFDFSNIIGQAPTMLKVFERIKKAAGTKSTILIHGESGTGKELLAKAIHFNSDRKLKPLVTVDCTSIPRHLLESELFGHLKGAFTGADHTKKGLCEEANGGTLFLDEIGEIPLDLQSKLLRLLQENTIRRVGDTQSISLDVRIIAATHRDLEKEVKEGRFRQDLYYRLNVVPLTAPSLRERREDIPLLARFFLKRYTEAYHRNIREIDSTLMNRLLTYDWPGNVRQLENLIEQMVVMSDTAILSIESLPESHRGGDQSAPAPLPETEWDIKKVLASVQHYTEETLIRKALHHTQNNKTKAATLLGLSRRALIYKAQEYKIDSVSLEDEDLSDS